MSRILDMDSGDNSHREVWLCWVAGGALFSIDTQLRGNGSQGPISSLLRHILGGPGPSLILTHISTLVFSGRTASGQTGIPRLFSVLDTNGSGGAPEPAAMKTRHWPPDQSLGAPLCRFRGPVLARFSTLPSVLW